MCKIMLIAGIKDNVKSDVFIDFIFNMGTIMSKNNEHGLGYAGISKEGELFGERWLKNDEAFLIRPNIGSVIKKFNGFIEQSEASRYNKFGTLRNEFKAITLHTRYATSGKEFFNTHPFVDKESATSVIHNGVINNVTKEDNVRSTCDSERILNKYLEHDIVNNPENIQAMIDDLRGYYATGIFSKTRDGLVILDILKSNARLSGAYIKEFETFVFTTEVDDVIKVCSDLGLTIVDTVKIKDDTLCRLNALTGEPILIKPYEFKSNFTSYNSNESTSRRSYNSDGKVLKQSDFQKEGQAVIDLLDHMNKSGAADDGWFYEEDSREWKKKIN